jgi:hypothetical protein
MSDKKKKASIPKTCHTFEVHALVSGILLLLDLTVAASQHDLNALWMHTAMDLMENSLPRLQKSIQVIECFLRALCKTLTMQLFRVQLIVEKFSGFWGVFKKNSPKNFLAHPNPNI